MTFLIKPNPRIIVDTTDPNMNRVGLLKIYHINIDKINSKAEPCYQLSMPSEITFKTVHSSISENI